MKVAVLTDSSSNYFEENIQRDGLYCVSLQVVDGERGYREGLDLSNKDLIAMLEEGKLLKTSGPTVSDVEAIVDQIKADGYDFIFSVNITTGLSSTISTVQMVAQQKGLGFDYFDCYSTARIELEMALKARDMLDQGQSLDDIKKTLEDMRQESLTFIIPQDISHLVKGGRINPLVGKLVGFLKINPILWVSKETGGRNDSFKTVRTWKKALNTVINYFVDHKIDASYRVCIAHVNNLASAQYFKEQLSEKLESFDGYITDLVSVVGVHTGLGTLACQFVKK